MPQVELLSHQGTDDTVANTARVSMQFGGIWNDLPDGYTEGQRNKLIKYLATNNHTSPFRHNSITVRISVPIFLARQLGKHQVGMSWNEVSRRYVDTPPTFFIPKEWRARPDGSIKQGSVGVHPSTKKIAENYAVLIDDIMCMYQNMIHAGVAPEQARMILPQSMMTEVVWTGSLMAFAHVYKLRADAHAQVEAQEFAEELGDILRPLFPVSWAALVGH